VTPSGRLDWDSKSGYNTLLQLVLASYPEPLSATKELSRY